MTGFLSARFAITGTLLAIAGAAFLALTIFAGVQTARIEGFHVWPVSVPGWKKTAQDRQASIDRMIAAQDQAEALAKAARLEREKTYADIAERIDDNAQDQIETAMAAADRFIAAGGMRREGDRSAPCPARTGPANHAAEGPDRTGRAAQLDARPAGDLPPIDGGDEDLVLVSAADVRICTRNTVKAEAGRDLALQLQTASEAE